ncbi:MAG: oligopeptide/dipeptide ABC transporter ATP-binding protein [Acetobacteraceae bacterium]
MTAPLLEAAAVTRRFTERRGLFGRRRDIVAVDDVSFALSAGEAVGIVGESGCGKSTLARLLIGLDRPDSGAIRLAGENLATLPPQALRARRRRLGMVFQDPAASFDPRRSVGWSVGDPLLAQGLAATRAEALARAADALAEVGLDPAAAARRPGEFSGGQRQRLAIARALITRPDILIADEPTSALDVSVQAQVLNLVLEARERLGLALLLISHNLAVVRHTTWRTLVMLRGRVVEDGPTDDVLSRPRHPYTRALLDALPGPHRPRGAALPAADPAPQGCAFAPRCARATDACRGIAPPLAPEGAPHRAACHHPLE